MRTMKVFHDNAMEIYNQCSPATKTTHRLEEIAVMILSRGMGHDEQTSLRFIDQYR